MSNESSARRILPQSSQMSSFSFAPQQYPQRETQKNYVFVDEHNRHKRLKAMWQESVASVYEGGLKRAWDYEGGPVMKRQR
ncbi:hypothetical protein BN1723_017147 [Verticillium longisporum]|uniref:Uncharacterized protein n=1 Tax=Verticillium longisporum TaxID=100787 RepID=A0A0G4KJW1_VERLO|nr:hypothetical protein BN1723_017147 [Verticillium longisporum]